MQDIQIYEKQIQTLFEDFYEHWIGEKKNDTVFSGLNWILVLSLVMFFLIIGSMLSKMEHVSLTLVLSSFVCLGIVYGYMLTGKYGHGSSTSKPEDSIYHKIAVFLDMRHYEGGNFSPGLEQIRRFGFGPRGYVTHTFLTRHSGVEVEIQRTDWQVRDEDRTWYYYGVALSYPLRTTVKGTTVLTSDSLDAKFRGHLGGFKRIKLEWLDFEEAFDLFTTDEKGVREFMAPDVMEVLYDFYHLVNEPSMCVVFQGNQISFFYELGSTTDLSQKDNLRESFRRLYLLQYVPVFLKMKLAELDKSVTSPHVSYSPRRMLVNVPDIKGLTPIMYSILDNDLVKWEEYISLPDVDVNQCFKQNGNTLLHLAVANNRMEMVKRLLAMPALQPDAVNNKGQTALDLARERNYTSIVQLLEKYSRKE